MANNKITFSGTVSEVARGNDYAVLTISDEKRKSKIKCPFGTLDAHEPGDRVHITIDRDAKLIEKGGS